MQLKFFVLVMGALFLAGITAATEPKTGPVVKGFGPVFDVAGDALTLDKTLAYKVSMDVSDTAEDAASGNRHIESAARFLNMNPDTRVAFALVVHGAATRDLLTDAAFRERMRISNPNLSLLSALGDAGVTIYVCGQTAAYRGYAPTDFHPAVRMAESAMTAHVVLQSKGYTLIPF